MVSVKFQCCIRSERRILAAIFQISEKRRSGRTNSAGIGNAENDLSDQGSGGTNYVILWPYGGTLTCNASIFRTPCEDRNGFRAVRAGKFVFLPAHPVSRPFSARRNTRRAPGEI